MFDAHIAIEGEVGSSAHGLGLPTSDCDLMRVEVETLDSLIGLSPQPSTRRIRPRPENSKSQRGDVEITVYPVRKYLSMAMDGNPNVQAVLWTPNLTYPDKHGIRSLRSEFITQKMVESHMGFATNMVVRLKKEKAPRVNREELEAEHGYDTKSAYHAIRSLLQAKELCEDGRMSMPMNPEHIRHIMDIRNGKITVNDVIEEIENLIVELRHAAVDVPVETDIDIINQWLFSLYGVV